MLCTLIHTRARNAMLNTACGRPFSFAYFLILCVRYELLHVVGVFNCALTWETHMVLVFRFSQYVQRLKCTEPPKLHWTELNQKINTATSAWVCVLCALVCVQNINTECASEVYDRRSHTHRHTCLGARWASKLTRRANKRPNEPANDRLCVVVRGSFMLYVFVPKSRKDLFSWKSYEPQNRRALIEVPCVCLLCGRRNFLHIHFAPFELDIFLLNFYTRDRIHSFALHTITV